MTEFRAARAILQESAATLIYFILLLQVLAGAGGGMGLSHFTIIINEVQQPHPVKLGFYFNILCSSWQVGIPLGSFRQIFVSAGRLCFPPLFYLSSDGLRSVLLLVARMAASRHPVYQG